jgi:hypothetical protein
LRKAAVEKAPKVKVLLEKMGCAKGKKKDELDGWMDLGRSIQSSSLAKPSFPSPNRSIYSIPLLKTKTIFHLTPKMVVVGNCC